MKKHKIFARGPRVLGLQHLMSLLRHNKTRCTCVEKNTFIQNGGKLYHMINLGTLSRDKLMRLCFTEHIIKLTQVMIYYISALKKDETSPN